MKRNRHRCNCRIGRNSRGKVVDVFCANRSRSYLKRATGAHKGVTYRNVSCAKANLGLKRVARYHT